jgi:hypothetical protein
MTTKGERITEQQLYSLRAELQPLIGTEFTNLALPNAALQAFEPSQIGTIVGALMDALLPHLSDIPQVGLTKHEGILGDREGYPDYKHDSGLRVELKLLYVDNPNLNMKRPPTKREPSARLTQKVTMKNVRPPTDTMLLLAYQLRPQSRDSTAVSPVIIDQKVFSMIELVEARDKRLTSGGGMWFGNYETPAVLSKIGIAKVKEGKPVDTTTYGRKESEGKDFNEDTNFGKLKRIPHPKLQEFLRKCLAISVGEPIDQSD